jgi:hypothetical protein
VSPRVRAFVAGAARAARAIGVAWLAGCGTPDPVPEPAPPAPVGATPGPDAATPAQALPPVYDARTIDTLVPVVPLRRSAVARPIPAGPTLDAAILTLGEVVDRHAAAPGNPWAIAHALLARGAALRLADGSDPLTHLFDGWLEREETELRGARRVLLRFPATRDGVPVEPHTDLLLKNIGEAGFAPDLRVRTRRGEVTLATLYRDTVLRTWLEPQRNHASFVSPDDVPWSLQALAQWAPMPGAADASNAPAATRRAAATPALQWVARDGTPMDLDGVARFVVAVLRKETGFLADAMRTRSGFSRSGQPLFRYTCGGAHMLQGAAYAIARGFGTPADRAAVVAQVPLHHYRLRQELAQIDATLASAPDARTRLLAQRLKFLGHWLETAGRMQATGLYVPDAVQLEDVTFAARELAGTVARLKRDGVYRALPSLRTRDRQLWQDLVGDSAHALRGLELSLGRATIAW